MSGTGEAVLDAAAIAALREVADGDESFIAEIFGLYVDQAAGNLDRLRAALASGDALLFGRTAHAMAGASLHIGATDVVTACRAAETEMRRDGARPTEARLAAIEAAVALAADSIDNLRRSGTAAK